MVNTTLYIPSATVVFLISFFIFAYSFVNAANPNVVDDPAKLQQSKMMMLGGFIVGLVVLFFFFNYCFMSFFLKCTSNIGSMFLYSFATSSLLWSLCMGAIIFIFNSLHAILVPAESERCIEGLTTAFSNTVGYAVMASTADGFFTHSLLSPEQKAEITNAENDPEATKKILVNNSIDKLLSNKGILLLALCPSNFERYWATMIKDNVRAEFDPEEKRKELKSIVLKKDRVGECCWYFLTGFLVIMITNYHMNKFQSQCGQPTPSTDETSTTTTDTTTTNAAKGKNLYSSLPA